MTSSATSQGRWVIRPRLTALMALRTRAFARLAALLPTWRAVKVPAGTCSPSWWCRSDRSPPQA